MKTPPLLAVAVAATAIASTTALGADATTQVTFEVPGFIDLTAPDSVLPLGTVTPGTDGVEDFVRLVVISAGPYALSAKLGAASPSGVTLSLRPPADAPIGGTVGPPVLTDLSPIGNGFQFGTLTRGTEAEWRPFIHVRAAGGAAAGAFSVPVVFTALVI